MPRNPKSFKDLRADLADRVGEERVAAAEQAERDRYELEQHAVDSDKTSGPKRDDE
jgi:hypothetical protein